MEMKTPRLLPMISQEKASIRRLFVSMKDGDSWLFSAPSMCLPLYAMKLPITGSFVVLYAVVTGG